MEMTFLSADILPNKIIYGKNNFADGSKILLDTDLKTILCGALKTMSNAAKNFDSLATNLSVLHNYLDSSTKLLF